MWASRKMKESFTDAIFKTRKVEANSRTWAVLFSLLEIRCLTCKTVGFCTHILHDLGLLFFSAGWVSRWKLYHRCHHRDQIFRVALKFHSDEPYFFFDRNPKRSALSEKDKLNTIGNNAKIQTDQMYFYDFRTSNLDLFRWTGLYFQEIWTPKSFYSPYTSRVRLCKKMYHHSPRLWGFTQIQKTWMFWKLQSLTDLELWILFKLDDFSWFCSYFPKKYDFYSYRYSWV